MKKYREYILLGFDMLMVMLSYVLAIVLRYDFRYRTALAHEGFLLRLPFVGVVFLIVFIFFKTNKSLWSNVSIDEALRIFFANILGSLIMLVLISLSKHHYIPFSVVIIAFMINTLAQTGTRFSYRIYRLTSLNDKRRKSKNIKRVLIYGAGDSGDALAKEIAKNEGMNSSVIGFIDDNTYLSGKFVGGRPVFGTGDKLEIVIVQQAIDEIIIAMPSQQPAVQNEVSELVFKFGLPVFIMPSTQSILLGDSINKSLKKLNIVDLLQRKEIVIKDEGVKESIIGQNILVTGAAGSIGSELVRQIITFKPKSLTLIDINENSLYSFQQEINLLNAYNIEMKFLIASIRDKFTVDRIFKAGNFDLVFHAAAHKHVPLMEESPAEAIKNNIFGTYNLIEASKKYNVIKFVNISTDKAVNPTNVMGATKRFNEMMLQSQSNDITKFMAVRFGNVLGSNGSVVPLFKKQIEAGGPVTVTHKEITRYFMTIPEAVSLVLQAETYANGGEIFVLDMGEPVKILHLAEKMITLSGMTPYKDIDIEFSGLRPGEKLYEELLMAEEGMIKTENDLIFIAQPVLISLDVLNNHLENLDNEIRNLNSIDSIRDALTLAVPTYVRNEIV